MNTRTRDALIELSKAVQKLAAGTLTTIGMQTASEVVSAAIELEVSLKSDETVV